MDESGVLVNPAIPPRKVQQVPYEPALPIIRSHVVMRVPQFRHSRRRTSFPPQDARV